MAKVVLAMMAGAFLVAGVLLLVLPISHTVTLWEGSGLPALRTVEPADFDRVTAVDVPVDCGNALGDGPESVSHAASFTSEPCAEPIRDRRIAGGLALALGVVALVASIRIEHRSKGRNEPVPDPATAESAV